MVDIRNGLKNNSIFTVSLDNGGTENIEIDIEIGRGGSCVVYRGLKNEIINNENVKRDIIIKEFYPINESLCNIKREGTVLMISDELKSEFERQLQRYVYHEKKRIQLHKNDSKHVLTLPLFIGFANNTVYIVFDCEEGIVLEDVDQSKLDIEKVAKIMLSLCSAIQSLHKDEQLYLDCKPSNIFYTEYKDESSEIIRLFDFDTVTSINDIRLDEVEYKTYSAGWGAPEQEVWDIEQIGYESDIYSVGAVFFWLITGREYCNEEDYCQISENIFEWQNESVLLKSCNESTTEIINEIATMTLSSQPQYRWHDIGAFMRELDKLIDSPIIEKISSSEEFIINQIDASANNVVAAINKNNKEHFSEEIDVIEKSLRSQFEISSNEIRSDNKKHFTYIIAVVISFIAICFIMAFVIGGAVKRNTLDKVYFADGFDNHFVLQLENANHQYNTGLNNWIRLDYNRAARDILAAREEISEFVAQSDLEIARINNSLGCLYLDMGRYKEAYDYLNSAYVVFEEKNGIDSIEARAVKFSIAQYDYYMGDYETSLKTIQEIIDTTKQTEQTVLTPIYHFRAMLYEDMGKYDEALIIYTDVLKSYENIVQDGKLSDSLRDYVNDPQLSKYDKNSYTNSIIWISRTYSRIGETYIKLGRYDEAKAELSKGITLCVSNINIGTKNLVTSDLCLNYARAEYFLNEISDGIDHIDFAIRIQRNIFDFEDVYPGLVDSYDLYGDFMLLKSDYDEAFSYYNKAIELAEISFGYNHPQTASAYNSIGLYYYNVGDYTKAIQSYKKAIEIRKNILGLRHPETIQYYVNLAQAQKNQGLYNESNESMSEADRLRNSIVIF